MSDIPTQATTHVLVIGGGPLALLTALALKKRGIDVTLAGEVSPTNPPLNLELMLVGGDEVLGPLFQHSLACWRKADTYFGVDIPLQDVIAADLATSPGRAEKLRAEAVLDALGGEHVTYEEAPPPWAPQVGGFKQWEKAPLLPQNSLKILQKAVIDADIPQRYMNPTALSITDLKHPQLTLEDGSKFQARHIVFTSARALRKVLPPLGLALPLRPARGHVLIMETDAPHNMPLVLQRLQRGHLFVVPSGSNRVDIHYDGMNDPVQATFNVMPNSQLVAALQQHVGNMIPALRKAGLVGCKTAQEWLTPDFLPAFGIWPGLPGVLVGTGWGGRAMAYAAGAADLLAEQIETDSVSVDIQGLAPNRFASGLWQVVRQPGSLSWQEPVMEIDNSMLSAKPEYMENVHLVETPKAQYADKVNQVEKVVVESAARRAPEVKIRERKKVTTAAIKSSD